jgi:hypothetical protein
LWWLKWLPVSEFKEKNFFFIAIHKVLMKIRFRRWIKIITGKMDWLWYVETWKMWINRREKGLIVVWKFFFILSKVKKWNFLCKRKIQNIF